MTLDKWELSEICKYIKQNDFDYELINPGNAIIQIEKTTAHTRKYHSVYGRVERPILQEGVILLKDMELRGERVYNNSMAILYGHNKAYTSALLTASGIPHPKTIFSFSQSAIREQLEQIQYPVVLKPWIGGRGVGIVRADNVEMLRSYIELLANTNQPYYIQEYVNQHSGEPLRDMRAFVVGDDVLGVFYREASKIGWKTNICNGGTGRKCKLTDEIAELSRAAMKALNADIGGVDIIEGKDGYQILEVNVCPMFGGFYSVTGINPAQRIAVLLCSE